MTAPTVQSFDAAKDVAAPTGRPAKDGIDSPIYSTDEFRMYCFKVLPCSKRYPHNWQACPFAHPGEKARRRCLRTHKYTADPCTHKQQGLECPHGDDCSMTHSIFEYWLHPDMYRTQLCNDMGACKRNICFFAHSLRELRVPSLTNKPAATEPALVPAAGGNSSSASGLNRAGSLARTISSDCRTLSDASSTSLADSSMYLPGLQATHRTDSAGSGCSSTYAWELALQSSMSSTDSSFSSDTSGCAGLQQQTQYAHALQQQQQVPAGSGNLDLFLQALQLQQGHRELNVCQLLTQLSANTHMLGNATNPGAAAATALAAAAAEAASKQQSKQQVRLLASAYSCTPRAVGSMSMPGQPGLVPAPELLVPSAACLQPAVSVAAAPAYEGLGTVPATGLGSTWVLPTSSTQFHDILRGLTLDNLTASQAGSNNMGSSAGCVLSGNTGLAPAWSTTPAGMWSSLGKHLQF